MTSPNELFAAHTTSFAFNLSLSRAMVACLVQIADNKEASALQYRVLRALGLRDNFVGAARCLTDRGLITSPDPEWPGIYVLTEAGEHVLALLQIAGLVDKIKSAVEI